MFCFPSLLSLNWSVTSALQTEIEQVLFGLLAGLQCITPSLHLLLLQLCTKAAAKAERVNWPLNRDLNAKSVLLSAILVLVTSLSAKQVLSNCMVTLEWFGQCPSMCSDVYLTGTSTLSHTPTASQYKSFRSIPSNTAYKNTNKFYNQHSSSQPEYEQYFEKVDEPACR